MKAIVALILAITTLTLKSQVCNCEKEFIFIKTTIEENFAGFNDKLAVISLKEYQKKVRLLQKLTQDRFASDNCILIVKNYLDQFKSHHLGFVVDFDAFKNDTEYINHRPTFCLSDQRLDSLRKSHSWEGIYYFTHDSSYKVAVIKDKTPLHDYIAVIVDSKIPTWRKGLIKFEGKVVNDSLLFGILYMKNHRPKLEGFGLYDGNNMISGDWRREGTEKKPLNFPPMTPVPQIESTKLSDKTFYIKIASFDSRNSKLIDSILKTNSNFLDTVPYLILDLRDNGGGSDFAWQPIIPYLYTSPINGIGVDMLATDQNIKAWKSYLENDDLSNEQRTELKEKIRRMEQSIGHWVNVVDDQIDSSYKPKLFPKKIAVLVNKWCGSSTEEFILAARQSSKVIVMGENTIGNLDYSNVVEVPFSCYPYKLLYPTTRSRRVNIGQGIDNVGIKPDVYLKSDVEWIDEAQKLLENRQVLPTK